MTALNVGREVSLRLEDFGAPRTAKQLSRGSGLAHGGEREE